MTVSLDYERKTRRALTAKCLLWRSWLAQHAYNWSAFWHGSRDGRGFDPRQEKNLLGTARVIKEVDHIPEGGLACPSHTLFASHAFSWMPSKLFRFLLTQVCRRANDKKPAAIERFWICRCQVMPSL